MLDPILYPASVSVALGIAAILQRHAGLPLATSLVLILTGIAVAAFVRWKPAAEARVEPDNRIQRRLQRGLAEAIRLFIGTLVLAMAALGLLTAARHFSGG